MFNVGGGEIIVILLVALIVLGPERLPGAGRQIGRALGELRRVTTKVQEDIREAIDDAGASELLETMSSVRSAVDVRSTVAETLGVSVPRVGSVLGTTRRPAAESTPGATSVTIPPPDGLLDDERPAPAGGLLSVASPPMIVADILSEPS